MSSEELSFEAVLKGRVDPSFEGTLQQAVKSYMASVKRTVEDANKAQAIAQADFARMQKASLKEAEKTEKESAKALAEIEKMKVQFAKAMQTDQLKHFKQNAHEMESIQKRSSDLLKAMYADEAKFKKDQDGKKALNFKSYLKAEEVALADWSKRQNVTLKNLYNEDTKQKKEQEAKKLQDFKSYLKAEEVALKDWKKNQDASLRTYFKGGGGGGGNTPSTPSGNGGGLFGDANTVSMAIGAFTKLYGLIQAVKALYYTASGTISFVQQMLKEGLDYNQLIVESKYGIAGVVSSFGNIVDGTGKAVDATERWNASLGIADRIVANLQVSALKTKATYSDLARGITEGMAPMLRAGLGEDNVTPFVTRFVQVMSALRVPLREIGQEIRGLISGDTNARTSRVAASLFQPWLIEGKKAKDEMNKIIGGGNFWDWFEKNTRDMGKAGEKIMGTYGGALSNLKEITQRALGEGTEALWHSLTENIEGASAAIVTFDKNGKATFNENIIGIIKGTATAVGDLANKLTAAGLAMVAPGGLWDTWKIFYRQLQDVASSPIFINIKPAINWGLTNFGGGEGGVQGFIKAAINASPLGMIPKMLGGGNLTDIAGKAFGGDTYFADLLRGNGMLPDNKTAPHLTGMMAPIRNRRDMPPSMPRYSIGGDMFGGSPRLSPADYIDPEETEKAKEAAKEAEREAKRKGQEAKNARESLEKELAQTLIKIDQIKAKTTAVGENKINREYFESIADNFKNYEMSLTSISAATEVLGSKHPLIEKLKNAFLSLRVEANQLAETKSIEKSTDLFNKWYKGETDKDNAEVLKGVEKFNKSVLEKSKKDHELRIKREEEAAKAYAKALQEEMEDFESGFKIPVADMITELIRGGEQFGQIAADQFHSSITKGVDEFVNMFANLGIETLKGEDGSTQYRGVDGRIYDSKEEAAARSPYNKTANAGLMAVQVGMGAYHDAKTAPRGAVTSGVVGGAMAGLSMGSWEAAIVLALVGAVAGIMGKQAARDEYKYAVPNITSGGTARLTELTRQGNNWNEMKNINPAEAKQILARIQDTFDTVWNGFVDLLLKVPESVIPKMKAIDGRFQKEASSHFLKHMDEWINRTLPDAIAAEFKDSASSMFATLGMSVEKFNEMWAKLNTLDPKKALQIMGQMADTLIGFDKALEFFSGAGMPDMGGGRRRPVKPGGVFYTTWNQGKDQLLQERSKGFTEKQMDADKDIIRLASTISSFTGEAQIAKAKELSDLMVDRMEREKAFMLELIDLSESITLSADSMVREWTAEGLKTAEGGKDYNAQIDYWRKYANDILNGMAGITDPAEIQRMWNEYTAVISKIKELGTEIGPVNAEEIRKWAIEAIEKGNEIFQARLNALGAELDTLNQTFVDQIKPFLHNFATAVADLPNSIYGVRDEFKDLLPPLKDFREELGRVNEDLKRFDPAYSPGQHSIGSGDAYAAQVRVNRAA